MTNNIITAYSELPTNAEYNRKCHKALGAKWTTLNMLRVVYRYAEVGSPKEAIANSAKWQLSNDVP